MIGLAVGVGLSAWVASYCAVVGAALLRMRSPAPMSRPPRGSQRPRVLVLRPCAGLEPSLGDNLRASGDLHALEAPDFVFSVASSDDAAWPAVRSAARDVSGAIALVADAGVPNRKVAQLAAVLARMAPADDEILVIVDSDVNLRGYDLDALTEPIRSGEAAITWSAPVEGARPTTGADRISRAVLGASMQSFAVLGRLDHGTLVGKTFAISAGTLSSLGGMIALGDVVAEDMELARRAARHGLRVHMVDAPTRSMARGRSLPAVFARYTRWLVALRAQRPGMLLAYPLLLAAAPLLVLGSLALAWSHPAWGLALAAAVALARSAIARAARGVDRADAIAWPQIVLADLLLLSCAARACMGREVRWRGRRMRVSRGGRLEPQRPPPTHAVASSRPTPGATTAVARAGAEP